MIKVLILVGMVGHAALAVHAQLSAKHVPAEAKWALHLDLKALNESPMGRFIQESLSADAQRGLASLQAMSGINLTNDVDSLVVFGMGDFQSGGVMQVYGRFDVAKLTAVAGKAKEFQNKAFGERSLLSWSDKGKRTHLCIVDPTMAVLSHDEQCVKDAVARVDGGAGDGGSFAQTLSHVRGRFFALQASNLPALVGANAQLQMLKQAEAVLMEVGQMSGANGLESTFAIKAPTQEMAAQLSQAVQGFQALFLLQAEQNPEAAAVAQGTSVALQGDVVSVTLKLSEASLQKMVKVRMEQRQAAEGARRAARKAARERPNDGAAADNPPVRPAF